jgi:hypothetical protein
MKCLLLQGTLSALQQETSIAAILIPAYLSLQPFLSFLAFPSLDLPP